MKNIVLLNNYHAGKQLTIVGDHTVSSMAQPSGTTYILTATYPDGSKTEVHNSQSVPVNVVCTNAVSVVLQLKHTDYYDSGDSIVF
jgi:hypothetical protein